MLAVLSIVSTQRIVWDGPSVISPNPAAVSRKHGAVRMHVLGLAATARLWVKRGRLRAAAYDTARLPMCEAPIPL